MYLSGEAHNLCLTYRCAFVIVIDYCIEALWLCMFIWKWLCLHIYKYTEILHTESLERCCGRA